MKRQVVLGMLSAAAMAGNAGEYPKKDFDAVKVPTYPGADLNALYASTDETHETNENQFSTIAGAKASAQATSTRSIDSLFTRVPSSQELDALINGADTVGILQTIQTLVSNDAIPCGEALNYLLELLGRVRAAIEKKRFGADQLKVIIDGAKAEIERLNKEIARLNQAITDLWLSELQDKLAKLIHELEEYYNQFNFVESQIAPNEAKVAGYQKEIANFRKSSDEERNKIANDRLKLSAAEAQIKDLKRQLAAVEQNKAYLEASIESSLAQIAKNDHGIEQAQEKIDKLEAEIRRLRDQADTLRSKANSLEIQVERLRTDINVALAKEQKLRAQIAALNDRINIEEKKLATDALDKLNLQIQKLKGSLPAISNQVNRQYFYCYGKGAVDVEKTGDTVVYIVHGENFRELLEKTYKCDFADVDDHLQHHETPKADDHHEDHHQNYHADDRKKEDGRKKEDDRKKEGGLRSEEKKREDVHLECVDIFAEPYVKEHGYPFPEEEKKHYEEKKVTKFEHDFDCRNNNGAAGRGVIVAFEGNRYTIQNYANNKAVKQYIQVGACTVIMSTVKVPRVGMQIAFTGHAEENIINAGMITVW